MRILASWIIEREFDSEPSFIVSSLNTEIIIAEIPPESRDMADLIAEAGNVAYETGLSPRELAIDRDRLLDQRAKDAEEIDLLHRSVDRFGQDGAAIVKAARALLARDWSSDRKPLEDTLLAAVRKWEDRT